MQNAGNNFDPSGGKRTVRNSMRSGLKRAKQTDEYREESRRENNINYGGSNVPIDYFGGGDFGGGS